MVTYLETPGLCFSMPQDLNLKSLADSYYMNKFDAIFPSIRIADA